jgi:hypothetical protein
MGGAAAWPVAALAQQPDRMRPSGACTHARAENDPEAQARVAVLREGLAQLGWTERNLRIEERFAGWRSDQMQADAAELVGPAPDVIAPTPARPCGAKTGDLHNLAVARWSCPAALGRDSRHYVAGELPERLLDVFESVAMR